MAGARRAHRGVRFRSGSVHRGRAWSTCLGIDVILGFRRGGRALVSRGRARGREEPGGMGR